MPALPNRLVLFFDLTSDVVCMIARDGKLKAINKAFEAESGYSTEQVQGKTFIEFVHPDDRDICFSEFAKLKPAGEAVRFESRFMSKDGHFNWFLWSLNLSADDTEIVALGKNRSEEKKAGEQLKNQNRQLAEAKAKNDSLLASIGDGVVGLSDKGEIILVNKSAQEMLGFAESELLGKPFIHALKIVDEKGNSPPDDKKPLRQAMLTGKRVISRNWFYVKKDNSRFPVAITASPILLMGKIIGGVDVFRDITKEKAIDRMKTEFISLASHQLRTPLSAMKWYSEMLLAGDMGALNPEQTQVVNNITQSNERMIELVNALLNVSRIESGRIIIDPEPTDLKKLVDGVVAELQPKIDEKKHKLVISVHGDLPVINIDPKLVRHVYMNFISNAIKYTAPGGEIVVMISKKGDEVISQVSDNGFGIPKAQQEQVFQKFFRAENIIKVETDGTGLGLYLAKAVVSSSGGKVWFESEEGKGTSFWFSLPVSGSKPREGEVAIDS